MSIVSFFRRVRRSCLAVATGAAMLFGASAALPGQAEAAIITVKVVQVKWVKGGDALSLPDYYPKVKIGSHPAEARRRIKDTKVARPTGREWEFTRIVSSGKHDVVVEIGDKDILFNDRIDINRVANRKILSVTIDTRSCKISNISGGYTCGNHIVRAGKEGKSAEITFSVSSN